MAHDRGQPLVAAKYRSTERFAEAVREGRRDGAIIDVATVDATRRLDWARICLNRSPRIG